ncbi:Cytokine-inducible SH2-containing protein [Chionoecetes opilio]|uniref:Cytokine-inducible SH2-containing protein n=1 Tax=Chionoecetes opilio TaxID=41210 RepID=A0A8J5CRC0_CHIOP|nr:Cytokine-inducible SH2-containing protein [Chionoecetes opilio]
MMLVCPGCHIGMAATPALPAVHCLPAAHLTPAGVQPPYVCGRMFQMSGAAGMRPCLPVPHDACHMLCCLSCPHTCPVLRPCVHPEARHSLHTSGGGLVEGLVDASRSTSPDTKINHMATHNNPFLTPCQAALPPAKVCPANVLLPSPTHPQQQSVASFNPFHQSSPATLPAAKAPPKVTLTPPDPDTVNDSQILTDTRRKLEDSGWYYGSLTWQQAAALLRDTPVGTFLLRDSASPQCLYSLSVNTTNGPTSVRIHYSCGRFRLDCTGHTSQRHTPEFSCVVELVQHYVDVASTQVWVDHEGNTFSPIDIRRPLRRSPPSLQHLCRLVINSGEGSDKSSSDDLPPALRGFLQAYPHTV